MGVRSDGREPASGPGCMSSFERRHVQLSFKRSAVFMTAAAVVSGFHLSPLWMVAAYGVLFAAGLEAGRRVHGGSGRMFDRGFSRAVAWEEVRPGLTFMALFSLVPFAMSALSIFGHWIKERGDLEVSLEEGLMLLQAAFGAASQWDNGAFLICAAMGPLAGAVCGAMDGFWVGTLRSKRDVSLRDAIPLGVTWSAWRWRENERRRLYLRGDSKAVER